jgi:NAD dependent epimerase/dehydratase family enzyme
MRLLITGGSGVLGRALRPHAEAAGHDVSDAGRALLRALTLPSGIYNVCRDGERVSNDLFTGAAGWHPQP